MSVYFSQPQLRSGYTTRPLSAVVSPVTTQELADWLRLDDNTDPLLSPLLTAATSYVIERLQSELLNRDRVVVYQHWPMVGRMYTQLSQPDAMYENEIKLPYATLQSVTAVTIYGGVFTDYQIQQTTPATLYIDPLEVTDVSDPAIEVQYVAGYGDEAADVPEVIRIGVTMMAAYLYSHRGACDAVTAFGNSGARELLTPYMNELVVF